MTHSDTPVMDARLSLAESVSYLRDALQGEEGVSIEECREQALIWLRRAASDLDAFAVDQVDAGADPECGHSLVRSEIQIPEIHTAAQKLERFAALLEAEWSGLVNVVTELDGFIERHLSSWLESEKAYVDSLPEPF